MTGIIEDGDRLLTVGEVAAELRVSKMTVYRLVDPVKTPDGIKAIRVGRSYRVKLTEVRAYLARSAGVPSPRQAPDS